MEQKTNNLFVLLDTQDHVLAHGELIGKADGANIQVRVPEEQIGQVLEHEIIQILSIANTVPPLLGKITAHRRDMVVLDKIKTLAGDIRQNLRIPVKFDSFIYPLTGRWKGRRAITSKDLSCGGVAFFCTEPLETGEEVEVVIPITSSPLILHCKILRNWAATETEPPLYASKFLNMCNDEEMIVQTTVFSVQIDNHARDEKMEK